MTIVQLGALARAAGRELSWGLREVTHELRGWRRLAEQIPDAPLRTDALHALTRKRGHADGAALFTIVPQRREPELLRLLVAYETLVDFLDDVSERHPTHENGMQLHRAAIDALDPDHPLDDWYRHHPWHEDGGYLAALVHACREGCRALPSFERVRPLLAREARRSLVLGINHDPDASSRDAALRAWALAEFPHERRLSWFELSGGASATLLVLALLTLAACEPVDDAAVAAVHKAYWPWASLVTTMIDSFVDEGEDRANGNHNYLAHYRSRDVALERLRESIERSLGAVRALPEGERHAVIVACMVALFLSKDSARTPALRASTRELAVAGGPLVRLLLPILRVWRIAYGQRTC